MPATPRQSKPAACRFLFQVYRDPGSLESFTVSIRTFTRELQWETTSTSQDELRLEWRRLTEPQYASPHWGRPLLSITGDSAGTVMAWAKLAGKIADREPVQALEALEALGGRQGADSRTMSRLLPLDELPEPGTVSYRDIRENGTCTVHAYLAPHERTNGAAERAVFQAFAKAAAKSSQSAADLEWWLTNGKPIEFMQTEKEPPAGWRQVLGAPEAAAITHGNRLAA